MMKKLLFALSVLLVLLVSCASGNWMANPYSKFPQADYVCGVGYGKSYEEAELAARKELASQFGMAVQSTVSRTLIETSAEKNGASSESFSEFFSSNSTVSVNVDNLYGVRIEKRGEKDGAFVALAVMEKKATTDYYKGQLDSLKGTIDVQKRNALGKVGTFEGMKAATELVRTCEQYNTTAVMYNYLSGSEVPFIGLSESYDLYRQAMASIVLEVIVTGDPSGAVKSAVSKVFTDSGFAVSNGTLEPTAKATVTINWQDTQGTGVASSFVFASYNADVSLVDLSGNETVLVFASKGKEGHQNIDSARTKATSALVSQIGEEFSTLVKENYSY